MEARNDDTIRIDIANELLPYAQNSDDAVPAFSFFFLNYRSAKAIEFAAACFKKNTKIEHFQIRFVSPRHIPPDSVSESLAGIYHFIANNPSLISLELLNFPSTGYNEIATKILQAVDANKNIKRFMVEDNAMQQNFASCGHLKEIDLDTISAKTTNAWPTTHSIETLFLYNEEGSSQEVLDDFSEKLLHESSSSIRSIQLAYWSPRFSTFLTSPMCHATNLGFLGVDFRIMEDGTSVMDGLLWGLVRNRTIERLHFEDCLLDSGSLGNFLHCLKTGLLRVKHVGVEWDGIPSTIVKEAFSCECLQSLTISTCADLNVLKACLVSCRVPSLHLLNGPGLHLLAPALKAALTFGSLTKLGLSNYDFCEEAISALVDLIRDKTSHLETLTIIDNYDGEDDGEERDLESALFPALEDSVWLQTLSIQAQPNRADSLIAAFLNSLENFKSLRHLSFSFASNLSTDQEHEIGEKILLNWTLENISFTRENFRVIPFDEHHSKPSISLALRHKIHSVLERNKSKNMIFSPGFADTAKPSECCARLQHFWDLPDGLTLAFWMLETAPHLFFNNCVRSVPVNARKKRRIT